MITASIISFSSDVTCQAIESVASKGAGDGDFMKQYDIKRSMRLSAIGAFLLVPIMHNWYGLMGRVLPGRGNKVTIAKVILDQFVLSPPIVAMVLSANQILDGKAYNIPSKMKEVGLNILVRNWLVWGPVQVLNYKFVPVQFQVLFSNTVNYFWSIYVSSANNAPLRGHHTDTAAAAVSASAGQLMELQGSKP
jgi:protein Mpv17